MIRSLDHDQMTISCTQRHPPVVMATAGFYALKEAGAKQTIIAFLCPKCYRTLYVTCEQPYPANIAEIDQTP